MGDAEQEWPELPLEEHHRWWKEAGARELRQILLWRWDPIGVADYLPSTEDEYDSYLGGLAQLLRRAASVDEIAQSLHTIETERIEMETSPKRRRDVAELTRGWYPNSIWHWRRGPLEGQTPQDL